jgi:nitroimidazol reductase NimA-like FMN-containing flavoprotein (pyridoxamine 5'-phosphate oxidase superfamily)
MNFGCDYSGDLPILYFHCAREGRKIDCLRRDPGVGFEIGRVISMKTADTACKWSCNYESVIGEGVISEVTDAGERIAGLRAIMDHYTGDRRIHDFDPAVLPITTVLKIAVASISGKRLLKE